MDDLEVQDELDTHLALRTEENLARGLTPDAARAEAERRFGPLPAIARESARIRRRQSSLRRAIAVDFAHALRAIVRAPFTTAVGAAVMAVGLATVAAAWLVGGALLRTPPAGVRDPQELFSALEAVQARDGSRLGLLTYRQVEALEIAAPEARPIAWGGRELQVVSGATARPVAAALVTGNYFETLRASARSGRLLTSIDSRERRLVCVLSPRLSRAFGDAGAIGRTITVNGQPFEVVGVGPERFQGLEAGDPVDLWLPLEAERAISSVSILPNGRRVRGYVEANIGWLRGAVRIPRNTSTAEVAAKLTAADRATVANAALRARVSIALAERPWISPWPVQRERLTAVLVPLGAAAWLTLVLTSACLASLFAARISDRRREFAVHLALGAGRMRIIRSTGFEMGLVSIAGAAAGWLATQVVLEAAKDLVIANDITVADAAASIGGTAPLEFAALALVMAALAVVAPLAYVARLCHTLRVESSRGTPGTAFRRLLIAVEVAGACALLTGAGMMTESLLALRAQPLGFEPRRTAFVELDPSGAGLTDEQRAALVERIAAGSERPALSDELPFGGTSTIFASGDSAADKRQFPVPVARVAGPYFETLGVRLVAGRLFEARDRDHPVAILSEPLARAWWPNESAIGRFVRVGDGRGAPREVIGVVAGLRDRSLRAEPTRRIYLPLGADFERLVLLSRSADRDAAFFLVERARSLDPRLVPLRSGSIERLVARTLEQRRALQIVSATIGIGALLMVIAGVWGLAHGNVRHRRQEFGIRLALGAAPREVGRLAFRDAWIIGALGGGGGVVLAWQFGKILQQWLFGVTAHDPRLLTLAAVIAVAAAVAGVIGPVRQAMRTDPASLLRDV